MTITSAQLEQYQLGETTEVLALSTREENYITMLSMLQQAHSSMDLLTHKLDGHLYNTAEFADAFRQLAISNRNPSIRILVHDSNYLGQHGHRFLEIARRLTSSIEIRKVDKNFQHLLHNYTIFDRQGVIFRPNPERFEAKADFHAPAQARERLQEFDKIWQHSETPTELRRMHI